MKKCKNKQKEYIWLHGIVAHWTIFPKSFKKPKHHQFDNDQENPSELMFLRKLWIMALLYVKKKYIPVFQRNEGISFTRDELELYMFPNPTKQEISPPSMNPSSLSYNLLHVRINISEEKNIIVGSIATAGLMEIYTIPYLEYFNQIYKCNKK